MVGPRRFAVTVALALVASVIAGFLPLRPFYLPALAVLLFLLLSYFARVTSLWAAIALAICFALLAPVVLTVGATEHMPWHEAFAFSLRSIGEQPVLLAYTLLPIVVAVVGYAFVRWLDVRRNAAK